MPLKHGVLLCHQARVQWHNLGSLPTSTSQVQAISCLSLSSSWDYRRTPLIFVFLVETGFHSVGQDKLPLPSESVDIIISDIPFGKKFKLGKDIKSILQEMERVLHVGGIMVLLLSEDHHRRLTDYEESSVPFNSKDSHTDKPGIKKCLIPEEKTGASKTVSTSFEASNHEFLDKMSPFGSLVPVECYKVSLGKTAAFICKYKKSHSSGLT
ncbi:THUMP domain-containing protein 2 [Plecturocebus cupreus]